MGGGGFGGQQQQGGFGGGYGMPQQQQGGFGGFGGFGGGYGMPQQQQGGFGGFGGFGGGFGMPQQQQGFSGFGGFNQMPQQQQGFGGGYQPSRQRFNQMPQQQGFGNTFARTMPPQQGFGGGYGMPQRRPMYGGDTPMAPQQRNPMQPMVSFPAPQQDFNQPSPTPEPAGYGAMMDSYRQQANQMMAAQNAAERSRGIPTYDANTDPLRGIGINIAQPPRPMTQPMAPPQAGSDAARLYEQFQSAQGMRQPMVQQKKPGGGYSPEMQAYYDRDRAAQAQRAQTMQQRQDYSRPQVSQREPVRDYDRPQTFPMEPLRDEDPRMQAMRNVQRMNFNGGYDF